MEKPYLLQLLEVLQWRTYLTKEEEAKLYSFTVGYAGELDFHKIIHYYVPAAWILLTNLHYKIHGRIEIDALLLTGFSINHFEVKNFISPYKVVDGQWYSQNNDRLTYNPFFQRQRAYEGLLTLMNDHKIISPVDSKLVLINPHETVDFQTGTPDSVLKNGQIQPYLEKLKSQAKPEHFQPKSLAKKFLTLTSEPDYSEAIDLSQRQVKSGIICLNCHNNRQNGSYHRYRVECNHCGYQEGKEKAVFRTIGEYSLLYPHRLAIKKDLLDFIATDGCEETLIGLLKNDLNSYKIPGTYQYNFPKKALEFAFPNKVFRYKDRKGS